MRKSFLLAFLTPFLSCVFPQQAGTSTETDTGCAITGFVRHANGHYASDASVVLHDQKKTNKVRLAKRSVLIRSGTTSTNINGFFQIDSVDTGAYIIEISDHDTFCAVVPATVTENDTLIQINSLLGRSGCIRGKIDTSKVSARQNVAVYLPEIQRAAKIDSSGDFFLPSLPAWEYQVRIACGDSLLALASDSIHVPVAGGDTTFLPCFGSKTGSFIISGKIIEQPGN